MFFFFRVFLTYFTLLTSPYDPANVRPSSVGWLIGQSVINTRLTGGLVLTSSLLADITIDGMG